MCLSRRPAFSLTVEWLQTLGLHISVCCQPPDELLTELELFAAGGRASPNPPAQLPPPPLLRTISETPNAYFYLTPPDSPASDGPPPPPSPSDPAPPPPVPVPTSAL